MITSMGTNCSCSKPFAHTPRMKPKRQNVAAVITMKATIHAGCTIEIGTNRVAVARITAPRMMDLVVAAPT